jgi:predicted PurR-regulated permease PerM
MFVVVFLLVLIAVGVAAIIGPPICREIRELIQDFHWY